MLKEIGQSFQLLFVSKSTFCIWTQSQNHNFQLSEFYIEKWFALLLPFHDIFTLLFKMFRCKYIFRKFTIENTIFNSWPNFLTYAGWLEAKQITCFVIHIFKRNFFNFSTENFIQECRVYLCIPSWYTVRTASFKYMNRGKLHILVSTVCYYYDKLGELTTINIYVAAWVELKIILKCHKKKFRPVPRARLSIRELNYFVLIQKGIFNWSVYIENVSAGRTYHRSGVLSIIEALSIFN